MLTPRSRESRCLRPKRPSIPGARSPTESSTSSRLTVEKLDIGPPLAWRLWCPSSPTLAVCDLACRCGSSAVRLLPGSQPRGPRPPLPLTWWAYSRRVSAALEKLRGRLAELSDLAAVEMLVHWDQLVMMPAAGATTRAQQLGALARLTHERATAEEIGGLLEELEGVELEELDRDIVRLASRDW